MTEEVLTHDVLLGDGSVIPAKTPLFFGENGEVTEVGTHIPYYLPKHFPSVIRRNTSCAGQLLGQSDCAFIRPQQQAINKV